MKRFCYILPLLLALLSACRTDEMIVPAEYDRLPVDVNPDCNPVGMYLLNEGNMGSNKASIDFVDFANGLYARNLYAERNPTVIKELGDVGNDIQIYGSKLYAVINCSHKVEVMDARTLVRIGQIDIPNCRNIRFARGKAYVSAYVGPISIDPAAQPGAVYCIDTTSLTITGKCTVGYQPDELEILGDYIYVANSGGYRKPHYDYMVSVVEIESFRQQEKIPVGINLQRIRADRYGKLWVSSRGDLDTIPSRIFILEREEGREAKMVVTDTINIPCSQMAIMGDSLYICSVAWDKISEQNRVSYAIINIATKQVVTRHFITDGTEQEIVAPYGLAVNPSNGDIYITDAKNYVSSGMLHCYSREGKRRWSIRTGDVPAHITFLYR